ncbi:hypothetical protein MMC19_006563 [Ptychographa xylographoides]|nr:hypothetical protein [Ptychographa xylographoides]
MFEDKFIFETPLNVSAFDEALHATPSESNIPPNDSADEELLTPPPGNQTDRIPEDEAREKLEREGWSLAIRPTLNSRYDPSLRNI